MRLLQNEDCTTRINMPQRSPFLQRRPGIGQQPIWKRMRSVRFSPDTKTIGGWRDYTLLLFLYNTGSRVSEAAGLSWNDLQLTTPRQVRLHGKGRKDRLLPLWRETAEALRRLGTINHPDTQSHVFLNRHGEAMSRDGIAYILRRHVQTAARDLPALAHKRVRRTS